MTQAYRTLLSSVVPLALFALVFLSAASVTRADTLTFSTLEQTGGNLILISDPYLEAGYKIQDGGALYFAQQGNSEYAGSAGLHERISNGTITLTRADGNAFTLSSIDLSVLNPGGVSPAVVFTGVLAGGGTVTQTFTPTVFGFRTFVFSSAFTNLTSVTWHQGTGDLDAHQFDNIVVSSVPEPISIFLFGSGLVGITAKLSRRNVMT